MGIDVLTSWVRRKSLKKANKSRFLITDSTLSPVVLLGIAGLLIVIGIFVINHTLASSAPDARPAPNLGR